VCVCVCECKQTSAFSNSRVNCFKLSSSHSFVYYSNLFNRLGGNSTQFSILCLLRSQLVNVRLRFVRWNGSNLIILIIFILIIIHFQNTRIKLEEKRERERENKKQKKNQ
jgi:hypothetical protein